MNLNDFLSFFILTVFASITVATFFSGFFQMFEEFHLRGRRVR